MLSRQTDQICLVF